MGVNEWPGGQWKTAGVYRRYEASNSKLLLIGQGMQTAFFDKSNKIKRADQISATVVLKGHSRGGQTCSMYEPQIVKPKLQKAAT